MLVAGGWNGYSTLNSAELYDPSLNTWTTVTSMNTARDLHTATILTNGKVLVSGGWNSYSFLNSAEFYSVAISRKTYCFVIGDTIF